MPGGLRQDRVDLHNAMYPHLAACSRDGSGEQRNPGGQETTVADPGALDVGMRPDEDIIADDPGVLRPAADQGVFHHDAAGADADRTSGVSGRSADPVPPDFTASRSSESLLERGYRVGVIGKLVRLLPGLGRS
jgi:hypothetical protein